MDDRDSYHENREGSHNRNSREYQEYLRQAQREDEAEYRRQIKMSKMARKNQNRAEKYVPKQMESEKSGGGFLSSWRNRNSPENRRKRIDNLKLKAEEEHYKSQVYLEKNKRGGSLTNKILTGGSNYSSGQTYRPKRSRSSSYNYNVPQAYQGMSQNDFGMDGLNNMFGFTNQPSNQPKRRSQKPQRDGFSEMFSL